jgi:tetratricopeptide (TPR) repeat protein
LLLRAAKFQLILIAAGMTIVASHGIAQMSAREYCNRGVAKQRSGDLDGAIADYNKSIELNPHSTTPFNNRGLVKMAKGDLDGAMADYERALQISPRSFEAYDNRGAIKQKKGDLDGALADYNTAIKLWWKYIPAYSHRASIEITKKDFDNALTDVNYVIAVNRKDATAYHNRALIETAKGELDAATADFEKAAKLDPKNYGRNHPPTATPSAAPTTSPTTTPSPAVASPQPTAKAKPESSRAPDTKRSAEVPAKTPEPQKSPAAPAPPNKEDLNVALPKTDFSTPIEVSPKNIAAIYDRDVAKRKKEEEKAAAVNHNKPAAVPTPKNVETPVANGANTTNSRVTSTQVNPTIDLAAKSFEPSSFELGRPSAFTRSRSAPVATTPTTSSTPIASATPIVSSTPSVTETPSAPPSASPVEDLTRTVPTSPANPSPSRTEDVLALRSSKGGIVDINQVPESKNSPPAADSNVQPTSPSGGTIGSTPTSEPEPVNAAGYERRAQFKRTVGDLDGALSDYNHAIALDSKYAPAYNGRGNLKRAKQDLDGALADYSRAIELNGANSVAYYNRGLTKQSKGDLDGAMADFNPAIQLDPKNVAAYESRGVAKAMRGDLDGALADYNQAIELDSKDAAIYSIRGGLYFSARNWRAALEDYDRSFELSKEGQDYPRIYVWLIRTRLGQRDAANNGLIDYLNQRGKTVDWVAIAASYLLDGISESDLLTGAKSADKKQENSHLCEAWFYIGMKKLISGDKAGAQSCFNKSLATKQKDLTEYYFARAELRALQK